MASLSYRSHRPVERALKPKPGGEIYFRVRVSAAAKGAGLMIPTPKFGIFLSTGEQLSDSHADVFDFALEQADGFG